MSNVRNFKNRNVNVHDFAMDPRGKQPRSQFNLSHPKKMAFNFSELIPILVEPVLPGDTWNCKINLAARTAIPLVPVFDNWRINFFSFFVPMRLVWSNSVKFFGEQDNPGDTISYTIPTITSPAGGYSVGGLYDYMGLPTVGQVLGGNTITHAALALRAYNLIWNDWFRDENLQNSVTVPLTDGPDSNALYNKLNRGKRFDYINQGLPWPQKGGTAISLPLGGTAPVIGVAGNPINFLDGGGAAKTIQTTNASATIALSATSSGTGGLRLALSGTNVVADLSAATAATINQLRTSITLQQYLEADARGGTRYNEFVFKHYGVRTADARLQRPEMIGSGLAPIETAAIPQTSATGLTGGTTPQGSLAASGSARGGGSFTYSATEHGYIITLACGTADLTYQQGYRRHWKYSTRYDIPVPILAGLGEQNLYNYEIYADGSANDNGTFGYIPRWDEWRHIPAQISGIMRSTASGTIDYWHSSQKFTALPVLNAAYIQDDAKTVLQRNFTAGAATLGQQLICDFWFDIKCARTLPLYGIPGLTRL